MNALLRSVAAVVMGLVTGMAIVIALTYLAVFLFFGGDMTAPPTPPYLALNVAYSFGAAVAAGWLAGLLAGSRPVLHAAGVAVLMVLLSAGGGSGSAEGVPGWYAPTLTVLMPLGALVGGWVRERSVRAGAPAGDGGPL